MNSKYETITVPQIRKGDQIYTHGGCIGTALTDATLCENHPAKDRKPHACYVRVDRNHWKAAGLPLSFLTGPNGEMDGRNGERAHTPEERDCWRMQGNELATCCRVK